MHCETGEISRRFDSRRPRLQGWLAEPSVDSTRFGIQMVSLAPGDRGRNHAFCPACACRCVARSNGMRDSPHEFIQLDKPVVARQVRLTIQRLEDDRFAKVTCQPAKGAEGYVVRYGPPQTNGISPSMCAMPPDYPSKFRSGNHTAKNGLGRKTRSSDSLEESITIFQLIHSTPAGSPAARRSSGQMGEASLRRQSLNDPEGEVAHGGPEQLACAYPPQPRVIRG